MTFFLFKVFLLLFQLFFFIFLLKLFPFSPTVPFGGSFLSFLASSTSSYQYLSSLSYSAFFQFTFYFQHFYSSCPSSLPSLHSSSSPTLLSLKSPFIPSRSVLRFFSSSAQSVQSLRHVQINREIRADVRQGARKDFLLRLVQTVSVVSVAYQASYPTDTFPTVKRPNREGQHSSPPSAEVKKAWSCTVTHMCLHGKTLY